MGRGYLKATAKPAILPALPAGGPSSFNPSSRAHRCRAAAGVDHVFHAVHNPEHGALRGAGGDGDAVPGVSADQEPAQDAGGDAVADGEDRPFVGEAGEPIVEAVCDGGEPFAVWWGYAEQAAFGVHDGLAEFCDDFVVPAAFPVADVDFEQAVVFLPAEEIEAEVFADDGGGLLGAAGGGDVEIEIGFFAECCAQGGAHGFGLGDAGAGERGVGQVALHAGGGIEHGFGVAGENQIHGTGIALNCRRRPLPHGDSMAIVPVKLSRQQGSG